MPTPIEAFTVDATPRVVFGAGSVSQVPAEVDALGLERVLVVASPANHGVARDLGNALGSRNAGSFEEVQEHVPELVVDAARSAARQLAVAGVVTVGGGSAIGLGKAVALGLGIPVIAVPTTYSGSEMTAIYGITGDEGKRTGRDPQVRPRVVVYDPELTLDLPPAVTATSGFNALAHAIEAVYAPDANRHSSLFAVEAARILAEALPAAVSAPRDLEVRAQALYGAYLAGNALAGAGTALHHKLCHVLGGTYRLGHGDVNAVVLPHVVAYNQPAVPAALAPLATAVGSDDLAGWLAGLARRLATPPSLAALGLPSAALDDVAARTVEAVGATNPRPVDVTSLRVLLEDAHQGNPPRSWANGGGQSLSSARPDAQESTTRKGRHP